MKHTNYQPRKPGLIDRKIAAAKASAKTGPDAFGYLYGSRNYRKAFLEAMDVRLGSLSHNIELYVQRQRLHYSDRGDFTRCYRGGF